MLLPSFPVLRRASASLAAASLFAIGLWAQDSQPANAPQAPSATPAAAPKAQPFNVGEYSKFRSHFPNPIAPYTERQIPAPNLSNTPRIQDLVRDGKLIISMNDAIALALENNLDLAIARYNLAIADTDILRSKAGSSLRGVNSGVVPNTQGGSSSTLTAG